MIFGEKNAFIENVKLILKKLLMNFIKYFLKKISMKKFITLLLLTLVLASCGDQKEVKNEVKAPKEKYEVTLSNTNFGFNDTSKDFYVKVTRGNTENQYPTEDMMRLKAYMLSLQEDITAS